jgi:hypothetical protein
MQQVSEIHLAVPNYNLETNILPLYVAYLAEILKLINTSGSVSDCFQFEFKQATIFNQYLYSSFSELHHRIHGIGP